MKYYNLPRYIQYQHIWESNYAIYRRNISSNLSLGMLQHRWTWSHVGPDGSWILRLMWCYVHCADCAARWLSSTGGTWLSVRPTRVSHITCDVPIKGGAMFLAAVSASGVWRLSYIVVTIGERPCKHVWVWINTYRYIFNGMNIHLPAILGFTRYQGFDS